ncbi:jeltraxin-like [Dendropsophus ebraccatus]|uniref:jeltraxin-like n=1 Tax=Dendropsophus ebraccatus TaxID=150705 RepID=UPI003831EBED
MKEIFILLVLFSGFLVLKADKTIMLFPKQSITDYMTLKPVAKTLRQITVCLRSYSELTRGHSLFSLAMQNLDNAFLIFPIPPNQISISINNEDIYFRVDPEVLDWKHTCVTWDSGTGLVQLWINGKRYPRRVSNSKTPLGPKISVILGQEQENFGGGFDQNQCFVGELSDVNMWDYVLPLKDIKSFLNECSTLCGNIYCWVGGSYTVKGKVLTLTHQSYHMGQCKST